MTDEKLDQVREFARRLAAEQRVMLKEARKYFASRPTVNTLRVWCKSGSRGVVLESCREGAYRVTSIEAIGRFLERVSEVEELSRRKWD